MQVVGQEADAYPEGHHRDQRSEVVGGSYSDEDQTQAVDGKGTGGDGDDAGRKPVEAIDQVHRVRNDDDPKRSEEWGHVG